MSTQSTAHAVSAESIDDGELNWVPLSARDMLIAMHAIERMASRCMYHHRRTTDARIYEAARRAHERMGDTFEQLAASYRTVTGAAATPRWPVFPSAGGKAAARAG